MILTCILIFLARIVDVSLSTIRTVLVVHSSRFKGSIVAFFETLIWFYIARFTLINKIDSILIPIFYSLGFATGTYVGTVLANFLVDSLIGVEIITKDSKSKNMQKEIKNNNFGLSVIDLKGQGKDLLIVELNKKRLKELTYIVRKNDPDAFVMINELKYAQNGCIR